MVYLVSQVALNDLRSTSSRTCYKILRISYMRFSRERAFRRVGAGHSSLAFVLGIGALGRGEGWPLVCLQRVRGVRKNLLSKKTILCFRQVFAGQQLFLRSPRKPLRAHFLRRLRKPIPSMEIPGRDNGELFWGRAKG